MATRPVRPGTTAERIAIQACPSCSSPIAADEEVCPKCSTTRTATRDELWLPGLVLDQRFEVGEPLGRGAYANVYRGHDRLLRRDVAIKAVRSDQLDDGAEAAKQQFLREARLVARLEHPNVVQIYDAGEHDGVPWLAMQLVTGGSLQHLVDSGGALPPLLAVRVVEQAGEALDHAHALGIVHRDLKPANVLVAERNGDDDLHIKLGDFGIARVLGEPREGTVDAVVGTPAYMSPEQITGGSVGARSDLFSLGALAYEVLTGGRAFTGRSFHELVLQVSHGRFEPPSARRAELGREVDAVFARALAVRPDERFATGADFARALRSALPGLERRERAGRDIAGYEILDEAGLSLVSRVVKARRVGDGAPVALKVATDPRARVSLKHEIRLLSRLHHPAVPETLDAGEAAEATYLAREWVEGGERLAAVLASRRLSLPEACDIAAQIAEALVHVHGAGVLHLDLRPNSLVRRADGRILLGGFDRAVERGARPEGDLLMLGTPAYLSPEQIRQERELTEAADLYSLGVLLYELVAGRVPFVDPSPYLTAMRHLNEPAPPLSAAVPEAPRELVELVAHLLEKDPRRRPASAAEVARRLRAIRPATAASAVRPQAGVSFLEWRDVTVARVDLAGFVDLARRSAEGRVAFLLERWSELVARTTSETGGAVGQWTGGAALLTFIEGDAKVSSAVRALRALRALARYLGDMNRSLDWQLEFSGGVHFDRLLVGRVVTRPDEGLALVGDAPATATRLCARAGPGEVLASGRVQAEAGAEIELEPVEAADDPGAAVWRLRLG